MATYTPTRPPLESGDHLTREEFHRRYSERPDIKKAELVEGIVYVSSPVSAYHGGPDSIMTTVLGVYAAPRPGLRALSNVTVYPDDESEVQPDVLLMSVDPPGTARIRADGYVEGPPELVVEIAASSASYDLHSKRRVYEHAGVPEYVVWVVYERRILWLRLEGGHYVEVEPDANGMTESSVFPGLRLAVAKLLAGDDAGVLAALEPHR